MHQDNQVFETEQHIIHYLLEHPDFFQRYAQFLAQVRLSSGHDGRTISLQERQAELLREKIQGLERHIHEMLDHGRANVDISGKIHHWSCALAATVDPRSLPHAVTEGLCHTFDVPQVAIRVWDVAGPYMGLPFTVGVSEDAKTFASSLTMPFCGPNLGFEPSSWLHQSESMQSIALLPLREGDLRQPTPAFGMLVLGSPDPLRFDATMGTDFLMRIAEQASAALGRLRVHYIQY
ncbi:MAG: DUF484 family protein [Comamonas sp.]|nr:DUF484 family protein [Comamonas sp.]